MDLEILEALALDDQRDAALAQLLPGSEDHDYYRCLRAQHAGSIADAQAILDRWTDRHGHTSRFERLRLRQLWCRLGDDPNRAADEVRDRFGVEHWHEAEVAEIDTSRPSRLAATAFDGAAILTRAVDYSSDLSQVTDDGLYELLDRDLDQPRRRALLQRLGHTAHPRLAPMVAEDLAARGTSFGAARIHQELTLEQLHAVAKLRRELSTDRAWIDAVVRRMRPPSSIDLELDRDARERYLLELWKFVAALPPASNSLKAHVLWHLLDTRRRRDAAPDQDLFAAYLKLPRSSSYSITGRGTRSDELAELSAESGDATGLGRAGDDESLVRDLLHRRIGDAQHYAQWLERSWLDAEIATATLLGGTGDADRATLALGPARAAALRERIDLAWCLHNPTRFGIDEPIALDADVKYVPELVVKIFRVDPLAYFHHHKKEVGPDLDLDGLAASHELVMRFTEPAIRRVRRRIDLPMCSRAGTYIIDLIGNGMSSRAVIHKGRLRHLVRVGAAGHVVTVLDEAGRRSTGAAGTRVWVGDREYTPDDQGTIAVPFSTAPSATPMLLSCGDLATVDRLVLTREEYALAMHLVIDRQALTAGRTARALARVRLTCAGAPASLALLERTTWEVTLTDRHGVATTKVQPLVLVDDDACVLEWPLGDDAASVQITIRGTVKVISEQREQPLEHAQPFEIATMHATPATEALYLARTAAGFTISALGKTGEPRGKRTVTVGLVHRWSTMVQNVELATDDAGRIELGMLPGIERITVTLAGTSQDWQIDTSITPPLTLHARRDQEVVVPLTTTRTAGDLVRRMSLVEMRGGAPLRHVTPAVSALDGAIAIRSLPPGEYDLRGSGLSRVVIRIVDTSTELAGQAIGSGEILELTRRAPSVAELAVREGALKILLAGVTPRTRVHAIATRFTPSPVETWAEATREPQARFDRARGTHYVSGRELGDEYRYVLERRGAKRFPGLLLDKPSLLLNPWARRTTTTDIERARAGGSFGAAQAVPRRVGYGGGGAPEPERDSSGAYVAFDFLADPPVVLANLIAGTDGAIAIPLADLGRATTIAVIVDDPGGATLRYVTLPEAPLDPRDLRLRVALDPARHATQQKAIAPLLPGETLVIEDLATAKLHLIDTVERAHAYLLALREDATLREFTFVTKWHTLPDAERREQYSKYACHELHLFLYFKDRAFFDAVVRPYLAHKRTKTFVDHWLLDAELAPYVEPAALARLNAVERALLARKLTAEPQVARILGDEVAILPPDPATEAHLVDAVIGASTLDGSTELGELQAESFKSASDKADYAMPMESALAAPAGPPASMPPPASRASVAKKPSAEVMASSDALDMDLDRRRAEPPMFRAADRTQEWAENNWWHLTPDQSSASLVTPNRLWRDLANQAIGAFLSPWLGLATGSFAEAMCALAVTDLPFVAGTHTLVPDGARLTVTAGANALAGSSQLVDGPLVGGGAPLVVGQSYVRADDRYHWVDGEQVDKYVLGPLATGVVYTCQIVLANPTSSRQRVSALVQIPRGSIAVAGARTTHTIDVMLAPYGTHGHEFSFYFPSPGKHTHFPVHVSRAGAIIAAAPAQLLEVTSGAPPLDPRSWAHLSQRGSLAEVIAFLEAENLASIDLDRAAWRLRERPGYDAIIAVLERRRIYHAPTWGYALLHRDRPRIRAWARCLGASLLEAGPVLDMPIVELDAEILGGYEHLELAPLVNARAHRLGAKLRILNDGLAAQYGRFLDFVSHRKRPQPRDLLAAAAYLLAQDRIELGLATLARVPTADGAEQMQHDYVSAYAACLTGDIAKARSLATRWRDLPVDRWRRKFEALAAMLDELEGTAPQIVDPKSRDQQQADLAARQPTFELAVDRDGVVIRHQHVTSLELRFFEMDVELLFSRQPFVQSDVSRFSFIEPGHREHLERPPAEHRLVWPTSLRGKNVVVEAVGAGQRKSKIHYANDLAPNIANQYGQVRIQRASDRAALPATYVKVYARQKNGTIAFYKDGYTDLRGWFDYATLSTDDLDRVDRFAILVCSDRSGAAILEATPPAR